MYTTEIKTELLQYCNKDNMLLTLDATTERECGIFKTRYFILTFHVDNKVLYAPCAESNICRAFRQYDNIFNSMIKGRGGNYDHVY